MSQRIKILDVLNKFPDEITHVVFLTGQADRGGLILSWSCTREDTNWQLFIPQPPDIYEDMMELTEDYEISLYPNEQLIAILGTQAGNKSTVTIDIPRGV